MSRNGPARFTLSAAFIFFANISTTISSITSKRYAVHIGAPRQVDGTSGIALSIPPLLAMTS